MFDWDGWLLKVVYYYGFLAGISNFEVDWRKCRVFKTKRSTIFAVFHNALALVLVIFYWRGHESYNVLFGRANKLHEAPNYGDEVEATSSSDEDNEEVVPPLLGQATSQEDVTSVDTSLGLNAVQRIGSDLILGLVLQFCMVACMTLAISQYYLVMLFIRTQYEMLNSELRGLIEETKALSHRPRRNGVFMTKCCELSDRLDDIAQQQDEIQSIVASLGGAFGTQGLLVYTAYYLSVVSTAYLSYSLAKNGIENLGMTFGSLAVSLTWCFFYYTDALRNLFVVLSIQNEHRTLIRIMEERTVFPPGLDIRLELSSEAEVRR
ncbi:putative gustatory receptor 36a [Drosophila ananassae]|uniref:putative gustatory receptor 36a n=1 Tax=Drosophila ananassae TaxID=7217 RepID=UPI0013A5CD98|nr:putative gustatory receptor 36a [Drosophila ananassae]